MRTVRVYPLSDSPFTSQLYAGLFDLAANREINLEFTDKPQVIIKERDWGKVTNNRLAYLEIWRSRELVCKVCADFLDGPSIISPLGLEHCDVYFKRSYGPEYINSTQDYWQENHPEWRSKILPYGLNFPCYSDYEFAMLSRSLTLVRATSLWKHAPRGAFHRIKEAFLNSLSSKRALAKPGRWSSSNESSLDALLKEPAKDQVMFQTRLFDPKGGQLAQEVESMNDHRVALNDDRVRVVRALRESFGRRFVGGLWPEPYAIERYPNLLTNCSTKRKDYFELVKDSKVAVLTRGLRQSNGWRLPEYLGLSRCIASQHLAYQLPIPLESGHNVLYFENIDQCIESCDRILSDPALAAMMRHANLTYFRENVSAGAIIRRLLKASEEFLSAS